MRYPIVAAMLVATAAAEQRMFECSSASVAEMWGRSRANG